MDAYSVTDYNWHNGEVIETGDEKVRIVHTPDNDLAHKQEFLNLVLEAADTGDKSKLAAWWREHFPGYRMWLLGPDFQVVLPDDGSDE